MTDLYANKFDYSIRKTGIYVKFFCLILVLLERCEWIVVQVVSLLSRKWTSKHCYKSNKMQYIFEFILLFIRQ